MRKLIRCKRTQRFLSQDGAWTENIAQALQLAEHTEARAVVQQLKLQDVEVYYSFNPLSPSRWDFAISLAQPPG